MTDHLDRVPPERPRPLPAEHRSAMRDLLVAEVGQPRGWRRLSKTAAVGIGAGALVLAGGAASATYVMLKPATDVDSVICFTSPTTDQSKGIRLAVADESGQDTTVAITDPVQRCAQLWKQGVLTKPAPSAGAPNASEPAPEGTAPHRPPELSACTLRSGLAGVYPADPSVCDRLDLPNLG